MRIFKKSESTSSSFFSLLQMITSILQTTSFGKWAILKGVHWWKINFFAKSGSKRQMATWNWSNPRCFPMQKIKVLNSHALAHQCVHYEIITKLKHSHLEKGMVIIRVSQNRKRANKILCRPKGLQGVPGTFYLGCLPLFLCCIFLMKPFSSNRSHSNYNWEGFLSFFFFFFPSFNKFN